MFCGEDAIEAKEDQLRVRRLWKKGQMERNLELEENKRTTAMADRGLESHDA